MRSPREDPLRVHADQFHSSILSDGPLSRRKPAFVSRVKGQTVHSDSLSGRRDRRLPITVAVRLGALDRGGPKEYEKTYTDNVSAHGVRVKSGRAWHPGEQAEIAPLNEESPLCGEVVYCQKLDDARFFVGLKFPQCRIPWSVFKRFDAI